MRHEKIIENELNGTKIKIDVEAYMPAFDGKPDYQFEISIREKGPKGSWKQWRPAVDTSGKEYRKLGLSERREYASKVIGSLVTPAEILAAKMELWEKMKPE